MMSNKFLKIALFLSAFFLLLNTFASFSYADSKPNGPYTVRLSDKQRIYLLIDLLRQGVRQQKLGKIAEVMASDFGSGGKSLGKEELKGELKDLFTNSQQRRKSVRFRELKPVGMEVSSTWDFEIRNVKIHLRGDRATVDCDLIFWAAAPDPKDKDYPVGRRVKETFIFSRSDDVWRISRADKFLNFLESYGEIPLDQEDEETPAEGKPKREERKGR